MCTNPERAGPTRSTTSSSKLCNSLTVTVATAGTGHSVCSRPQALNLLLGMEVWTMFVKDAFQRAFSFTKFLCVMHATCNYVVTPTILQGPSMLPTIQITGDYALAQPISTMRGKVGRGDIVTARSPENPRKTILKRVMGLEGDQVTYNVDPTNSDSFKTIVVPEGHVWIEGDNEHDTHDSRHFGAIPYGLLEGRIFWRFWPPGRIGPLGKKAE